MKVLWVTNLPIGEAPKLMGLRASVFGGWLGALFDVARMDDALNISVAFPSRQKSGTVHSRDGTDYFSFPAGRSGARPSRATIARLREIIREFSPDLVHVFGTELQHSLATIEIAREYRVPSIVQIQGLTGSIAEHFMGWLPDSVTRKATLVEILRRRTLWQQRARFRASGELESEALMIADHVIGRTAYDRDWVYALNPDSVYHHVDENLRQTFYQGQWSLESCIPQSIFISQAALPYKGAHIALAAMKRVLLRHPEAKLSIAGPQPQSSKGLLGTIRNETYGKYLCGLAEELGVEKRVEYLGSLSESEMREKYLESNVFVSCSSIENSSNSISEAQLLGVPVVASYVGGVPDLIDHGRTGLLYQGEASYALANAIMKVFSAPSLASEMSDAARRVALLRHDRERNVRDLKRVYATAVRPVETMGLA